MPNKLTHMLALILILVVPIGTAAEDNEDAPIKTLDKIIAIVNEGVITESELTQQIDLVKQQLRQSNIPLPPMAVLRKQVLQHLIDVNIQLQLAKQVNLTVSNNELNKAVEDIATRNNMTVQQLHQEIQSQGLDYAQYRENIRREMTLSRLQQEAVGNRVVITDEQVDNYLKTFQDQIKANQEFHVRSILIPLPESPTPDNITQAETKAQDLLKQIQAGTDFSQIAVAESGDQSALQGGDLGWRKLAALPATFAQRVITMTPGDIAGPIRTGNGFHLIKLEAQRTGAEHMVTLTHVRQILLRPDSTSTSTEIELRLGALREQILQDTDFSEVAAAYSEDPASANKGGDLGWLRPGALPPNIEQAIDQLKPGEISEPLQSQLGWHLIEVLGRRTEDDSEYQIRQQIQQLLYQQKLDEAVQNWLQELRGQVYIERFPNKE